MSSKVRNIMAVMGFFIVLWLCHVFAFSKTWHYKKAYHQLKKEVQLHKDMPRQLAALRQKMVHYDTLLNTFQIEETSFQNAILKTINAAAETYDFKLVTFEEPHFFEQDSIQKNAYCFTVKGKFISLLKLIHHLEQETIYGEVIHCHFEKKKDRRHKIERLELSIIIQHLH